MLAREFHTTRDDAIDAALAYAEQTGKEDVWLLADGHYQSFPSSLRDLHRMIDPDAHLVSTHPTEAQHD